MAKCRHCGRRAIMFSDICSECWDREQEAARQSHQVTQGPGTSMPRTGESAMPADDSAFTYRSVESFALHHPGPMSLVIVGLCVVLALLTLMGDPETVWAREYAWGSQINELVGSGDWWRLLSAAFLHVGWSHLIGNMYGLFVVGSFVEQAFGAAGLLVIYVLAALGGSVATYFFLDMPSVGASGAIFGLFGAAMWRIWRCGEVPGVSVAPDKLKGLGSWAAYSLFMGFTHPEINNAAHLGGLATGTFVAAALPTGRITRGAAVLCATLLMLTGTRMAISSRDTPRMIAIQHAAEAARRHDMVQAMAELDRAVPLPQALELRAALRMDQGDYTGALQDTDALLKSGVRGDSRRRAHYLRARALYILGRPAEAYTALKPALGSTAPRTRAMVDELQREIVLAVPDSGVPSTVRGVFGLQHTGGSPPATAR